MCVIVQKSNESRGGDQGVNAETRLACDFKSAAQHLEALAQADQSETRSQRPLEGFLVDVKATATVNDSHPQAISAVGPEFKMGLSDLSMFYGVEKQLSDGEE